MIASESGVVNTVDPLGGASVHYWDPIREVYHLDITVVNPRVDPRFAFMTVDHDGKMYPILPKWMRAKEAADTEGGEA